MKSKVIALSALNNQLNAICYAFVETPANMLSNVTPAQVKDLGLDITKKYTTVCVYGNVPKVGEEISLLRTKSGLPESVAGSLFNMNVKKGEISGDNQFLKNVKEISRRTLLMQEHVDSTFKLSSEEIFAKAEANVAAAKLAKQQVAQSRNYGAVPVKRTQDVPEVIEP